MRDPKIEDWLKENGFKFQFAEGFPIDQIDMVKAKENPVRLDRKYDPDIADGYGIHMLDHGTTSKFPAVVLLERPRQALKEVMGGTHRLCGAVEAKFPGFDAYVVRESDPARIDILHGALNSLEGMGESHQGRLQRAAELVAKHPSLKIAAIAKVLGIKAQVAGDYVTAAKAERRADRLGVGPTFSNQKMPLKTRAAFEGLQSDNTFVLAVHLLSKHPDLRGGSGVSLLKELKGCGSESKAKMLIVGRDIELLKAEEGRKVRKLRTTSSKATTFFSRVHGVEKEWPGTVEKLYLDAIETLQGMRRELAGLERSIDIQLEVRDALKRKIEEREKMSEWDRKNPGASAFEPISPKS